MALAGCAGTGEVISLRIHPIVTGSEGTAEQRSAIRVVVGSIQSPQFTQRNAGAEEFSVVSINRESVKLGTMRP